MDTGSWMEPGIKIVILLLGLEDVEERNDRSGLLEPSDKQGVSKQEEANWRSFQDHCELTTNHWLTDERQVRW